MAKKGPKRRPKAKRKGQPAFKPTAEQRKNVEAMTGFGVLHDQIVTLVTNPNSGNPITPKTLRKHFKRELERGKTKMISLLAGRLFSMAMSVKIAGGRASVASAIFLLKTQGGFSERIGIEHSGQIDVDMVEVDAEKFRSRIARAAARIEASETDSESESG